MMMRKGIFDFEFRILDFGAKSAWIIAWQGTMFSPWQTFYWTLFAPVREQADAHTEKEVNADIDAAVAAVRGKRA
jgi:hypothetical protein